MTPNGTSDHYLTAAN